MISVKTLHRWFPLLGWPRTTAQPRKLDLYAALACCWHPASTASTAQAPNCWRKRRADLQPSVVEVLEQAGHLQEIGRENLPALCQNVIDAIYPKLASEICRNGPTRIFNQCQGALPNGEPRIPAVVPINRGIAVSRAAI